MSSIKNYLRKDLHFVKGDIQALKVNKLGDGCGDLTQFILAHIQRL